MRVAAVVAGWPVALAARAELEIHLQRGGGQRQPAQGHGERAEQHGAGVIGPCDDTAGRRLALTWLAVCCLAVGVWLLVIGVVYASWLAIVVGAAAAVFGVAELRSSRTTVP